ncbi:hypothetical protein PVAP13_7NG024878 [Panicum virgatum]|uniref:Uncharacterized protein n=1 Tax=Panicum virgatum TaxID=38727 RepID=A0A8T0PVJ3_PANVG|nr:hypothetical protein PVAP13_7NG024878 [Panicum virgatum]
MAATMNQSHQLHILNSRQVRLADANETFHGEESETYVLLPSPLDIHTTTQRKHAEAISTIFSMHHVSRSIFFSTPHKHPTRSCTNQNASQHVIAQQGLSEPSTSGLGCAPGTAGISYSCVFRLFERTYSIFF